MARGRSLGRKISFSLNLILWVALLLGLGVAYTPLTAWLLKPLAVEEEIRNADLIVVLGGGVDSGRYLTPESSQRLVRGVQLFLEGRADRILFSGGLAGGADVSEASVLAQGARRLKVATEDMILEKKARDTHEQAEEVKKICDALQVKSLLLVTSYSHMKRSLLCFEQAGFKVYPAFADPSEKYAHTPLKRLALLPRLMREYGAMIYYRIRGWI